MLHNQCFEETQSKGKPESCRIYLHELIPDGSGAADRPDRPKKSQRQVISMEHDHIDTERPPTERVHRVTLGEATNDEIGANGRIRLSRSWAITKDWKMETIEALENTPCESEYQGSLPVSVVRLYTDGSEKDQVAGWSVVVILERRLE